MKLFVDVDDTLIIWNKFLTSETTVTHSKGEIVNWRPNYGLIAFIRAWPGDIVIWSLGGSDYARKMAEKVLPKHILQRCVFEDRFPKVPDRAHLFIDDDPFESYESQTIHPSAFYEQER